MRDKAATFFLKQAIEDDSETDDATNVWLVQAATLSQVLERYFAS
jgi:hypothetical protein